MPLYNFFTTGIGEVAGLFSLTHLIYVLIAIAIILVVIFLTRNKTNQQLLKYLKIISITFLVLEILKIIWNLTIREDVTYEDYIPLYFCSFFIYASLIFAFSKNEDSIIYKFAKLFLFYGGITGGLAFSVFPTTSLMVFPLLHVLSIHSLIYHSFMVIVAIWMLKFFTPKLQDIKIYGIVLLGIELVIIGINYLCEANFMTLNEPFVLVLFDVIYSWGKPVYPFVMAIGQLLLTFYVGYIFSLILKKIYKPH